jgi:hypothetical protein
VKVRRRRQVEREGMGEERLGFLDGGLQLIQEDGGHGGPLG